MKTSFVLFCLGGITLYKLRRQPQNPKSEKIDGVIFGETGVNFAYQLGIIKYMQQTFHLDDYKFCGISGGCNCAFILSNKIDVDHFFDQFVIQIFNCKNQNKYTTMFDICKITIYKLYKSICDLQHMNDKLYVSMTKVFPFWHNNTVYQFSDYNDLFNSIKTSQYIPFLFGAPYNIYHNQMHIDGYLSSFFHYKPTSENWVTIKIWDFRFYYYLTSIIHFGYLFDEEYHKTCYTTGYKDAKQKHDYFLRLGFKTYSP
jgi:hypothetical protein